jgi:hypothetical protein
MLKAFVSILVLLYAPQVLLGCYLWGTDSGTCSTDTLDPLWRMEKMPFCAGKVNYPACLPKYKTLPPSREFPEGRWFNHTVYNKDKWILENYVAFTQERIALERNRTLRRQGVNEYGDLGKIKRRFSKRPDCQNAYKNLFCWLNFPRCDPVRDLTLPTCRSACENFFKSCVYERGLWRCGRSKYFNGYEPEAPMIGLDGNATYMRDYFPGQPFRQNTYTPGGSEHIICTPALLGGAPSGKLFFSMSCIVMIILSSIVLLW